MNDSWQENVYSFFLHRIPLLSTFILIFLFSIPIHSIEFNYFRPMIGMICVYYWGLKYPHLFGYISAFCIGFWLDSCSSSPLGVNCLLMMLLIYVTLYLGRYLSSSVFGLIWGAFGLVSLVLVLLKWLILSVYFGHIFSIGEIMFSYLTTLMFYPIIAYINSWVQNNFLPQESIDE